MKMMKTTTGGTGGGGNGGGGGAGGNASVLWSSFEGASMQVWQSEWEPYNLNTRPLMRIDSTCELIYDRYPEERTLWRAIG